MIRIINLAIYASILCIGLFAPNGLGAQHENIKNDLDHLLGSSYYIIQENNSKTEIIIFPRFTVDLSGNVMSDRYPAGTVSFIENQLEKKYNITVGVQNPGYIPPYMIDEAIKKKQMKVLLLTALSGTIILFAGLIVYRNIKINR